MMLLAGDGVWTSFYMDPFNFQDLNLGLGNFSSKTLNRLLLVAALWSTSGQASHRGSISAGKDSGLSIPSLSLSRAWHFELWSSGSFLCIAFFFLHLCITLYYIFGFSSAGIKLRVPLYHREGLEFWSLRSPAIPQRMAGSRTAFTGKGLSLTQWNVFSEYDQLSRRINIEPWCEGHNVGTNADSSPSFFRLWTPLIWNQNSIQHQASEESDLKDTRCINNIWQWKPMSSRCLSCFWITKMAKNQLFIVGEHWFPALRVRGVIPSMMMPICQALCVAISTNDLLCPWLRMLKFMFRCELSSESFALSIFK